MRSSVTFLHGSGAHIIILAKQSDSEECQLCVTGKDTYTASQNKVRHSTYDEFFGLFQRARKSFFLS